MHLLVFLHFKPLFNEKKNLLMAFFTDRSELIAGYVMGLVSYLLKDFYLLFRRSNLPNKHDILAYSEYKTLFNSDLLMILQNQNFRNAFRPSTIDGFF